MYKKRRIEERGVFGNSHFEGLTRKKNSLMASKLEASNIKKPKNFVTKPGKVFLLLEFGFSVCVNSFFSLRFHLSLP